MVNMNSYSKATAAAVGLLAALVPASASAKVIELGATATQLVAPVCPPGVSPAHCTIVMTKVTGLETIRDGVKYPTTVTKAGSIVAWTVGVSMLSSNRKAAKKDIHNLDLFYGGTAQAVLTVLKAVGPPSKHQWTVAAQGPVTHLQPYFGQVVQFPLPTTLPVTPGEVIALSTPTWAPVLSIHLGSPNFAWRQSRATNCGTAASTDQEQLTIGATATYGCHYTAERIEYSATEVTKPTPTKNYVHAGDRPRRIR
jgi:hypothetical protein